MAKKKKKPIKKPVKKRKALKGNTFLEGPIHKTKIKVVGIGGGGSSIIAEIAPKIKKISFLAANTDVRALKEIGRKVPQFAFGHDLTGGLGTGMSPELGKTAAENNKDKIEKLLKGQDLCIITACLGGGTGSGSAPVFARISKSLGNINYGIFTLPFEFEGEKKMEIAKSALEKLKPHLNAVSIIPNDRIFQIIDKKTPLKEALSVINKTLAQGLEGLVDMIFSPGLVNIDFADLKTILDGHGSRLSYIKTVETEGAQRAEEALKHLLSSQFYSYTFKGAKGILYNIQGGNDLDISEVFQISKKISDFVNKKAKIIFGVTHNPAHKGRLRISLLATSCGGAKLFIKKAEKEPLQKEKEVKKPSKKKPIKRKKALPKRESIESELSKIKAKTRRSGLEVKKATEDQEKEFLEEEKKWETPAFLRRRRI